MSTDRTHNLNGGIISVLQTPFRPTYQIDQQSLARLIEDAIRLGVNGFLAPAVASEVDHLTGDEREEIVRSIAATVDGRVSLMVGASSDDLAVCRRFAALADEVGADAYLVAVPGRIYEEPSSVVEFYQQVATASDLPLVIQDLQWNGPGLRLEAIKELRHALPTLVGVKIETVPAGPKYTQVRDAFGEDFFVSGGWAVSQWIEGLDRGIDAMIPESSMIGVYAAILSRYQSGRRDAALELFRRLLPVLAFTNQEIACSIAFFKRLLVRRGIFEHETMRQPGFAWDTYNSRIADELIEVYLTLEKQVCADQ